MGATKTLTLQDEARCEGALDTSSLTLIHKSTICNAFYSTNLHEAALPVATSSPTLPTVQFAPLLLYSSTVSTTTRSFLFISVSFNSLGFLVPMELTYFM